MNLITALKRPVILVSLALYAWVLLFDNTTLISSKLLVSLNKLVGQITELPSSFSKSSSFPIVTESFFSLWLFLSPIMIISFANSILKYEMTDAHRRLKSISISRQIFAMMGLIALSCIGFFGFMIPEDPSFCLGCTTNSKLGLLVIYGLLFPLAYGFFLAVFLSWLKFLKSNFWSKK